MNADPTTPQDLVNSLQTRRLLDNWRLQDAFAAVPRHQFLPDIALNEVYSDKAVSICVDLKGEVTCSATMPSMVAQLLGKLDLQDGQNVLEIGTGTGYGAALIRNMIGPEGNVTSLEIERGIVELAKDNLNRARVTDINVVNVDGAAGYSPRAAYDRIVASVGIWDIPLAWIRQLKPQGVIVAPIALDGLQVIAAFRSQPDGTLYADSVAPSAFVYIRGQASGPAIRKRIGSTALTLVADEVSKIDAAAMHLLLSSDHERTRLSKPLNTSDYWYGFLPYLMLCESQREVFALYDVVNQQQAYGIEGEGFALFTPASACFVPYFGSGYAHSFAGADAYLLVESYFKEWEAAGRPGIDRLRLRLIPKTQALPAVTVGRVLQRQDHYLHMWMDDTETNTDHETPL